MGYVTRYQRQLSIKAIPQKDMRPMLVNDLSANAQWDYKAGRALPQVKAKGFPATFPCDANVLAEYHRKQGAGR